MKQLLIIGIMMLLAGVVWAEEAKVACDVNGEEKQVETADECKSLGGVVVETPT